MEDKLVGPPSASGLHGIPQLLLLSWPRKPLARQLTAEERRKRNVPDHRGDTPVHRALDQGDVAKLVLLVRAGAEVRAINKAGDEPIHTAVRRGAPKGVKGLLDAPQGGLQPRGPHPRRARPHIAAVPNDRNWFTPLLLAASSDAPGAPEILALLVEAMRRDDGGSAASVGAPMWRRRQTLLATAHGFTALHWACITRRADMVKALIDLCDYDQHVLLPAVNCVTRVGSGKSAEHIPPGQVYGQTPLMKAAEYKAPACIQRLVDAGADITIRDSDGRTAFHFACQGGSEECLRVLVEAMPEKFDSERPNPLAIADSAGHSPLIVALAGRQYGCIRLLRKAGARLDDITPEQQAELRQLEMDQVGQQLRGSFAAEAAKGLLYLCGSVLGHGKTVPG